MLLAVLLMLRLVSLGTLALSDPTESRYADIALDISRSGNWIMPQILIHGSPEPYWGKPPLHFWLTSFAFRLFGAAEVSARLTSFLAGLLMVLLTFLYATQFRNTRTAFLASIMLASSGLFFFLTGASAIDVTLSAAITGSIVSFVFCISRIKPKLWGILFFLFLALGMLTKGPIAVVLVLLPIMLWLLFTKEWSTLRLLPWTLGMILFLATSIPWFILAEKQSPGFLNYFFIHEHILRYLVHDYGDKYGSGHLYPRGTSWAMLIGTFLPWSPALIYCVWRQFKTRFSDHRMLFVLLWGITPALFFTFSRQLLATYVLPGFSGFCIAIAMQLDEAWVKVLRWQYLIPIVIAIVSVGGAVHYHTSTVIVAIAAAIVLLSSAIVFTRTNVALLIGATALATILMITACIFDMRNVVDDRDSSKNVVVPLLQNPKYANCGIVFPYGVPYSAFFYDQVPSRVQQGNLEDRLQRNTQDVFVMRKKQWELVNSATKERITVVHATDNWVVSESKR